MNKENGDKNLLEKGVPLKEVEQDINDTYVVYPDGTIKNKTTELLAKSFYEKGSNQCVVTLRKTNGYVKRFMAPIILRAFYKNIFTKGENISFKDIIYKDGDSKNIAVWNLRTVLYNLKDYDEIKPKPKHISYPQSSCLTVSSVKDICEALSTEMSFLEISKLTNSTLSDVKNIYNKHSWTIASDKYTFSINRESDSDFIKRTMNKNLEKKEMINDLFEPSDFDYHSIDNNGYLTIHREEFFSTVDVNNPKLIFRHDKYLYSVFKHAINDPDVHVIKQLSKIEGLSTLPSIISKGVTLKNVLKILEYYNIPKHILLKESMEKIAASEQIDITTEHWMMYIMHNVVFLSIRNRVHAPKFKEVIAEIYSRKLDMELLPDDTLLKKIFNTNSMFVKNEHVSLVLLYLLSKMLNVSMEYLAYKTSNNTNKIIFTNGDSVDDVYPNCEDFVLFELIDTRSNFEIRDILENKISIKSKSNKETINDLQKDELSDTIPENPTCNLLSNTVESFVEFFTMEELFTLMEIVKNRDTNTNDILSKIVIRIIGEDIIKSATIRTIENA